MMTSIKTKVKMVIELSKELSPEDLRASSLGATNFLKVING